MLFLDAGNSTCALAQFDGEHLANVAHLSWEAVESGAELPSEGLVESSAAVASVVPKREPWIREQLGMRDISAIRWLADEKEQVLPTALPSLAGTGVDRLLAARAGRDLYGAGLVVQAGSALTIDAVSPDGVFLGGVIVPGPRLWLESFSQTGGVPVFSMEDQDWSTPVDPAGRDTASAVKQGCRLGLIGAARETVLAFAAIHDIEGPIVISGGWGEHLARGLEDHAPLLAPQLVLEGMARVVQSGGRA